MKRKKKRIPMVMPGEDTPDDSPEGANSVDAPLDPPPRGSSVPRSGVDPPSRPRPQDHTLIKGLRPIGIGDKDGAKQDGEDVDTEDADFFGGGSGGDEFEPERLRGILPGLITVGYKVAGKTIISHSDAVMLTDQIIECAMADDSFRSMLDWLPTDCMLTVGVTAFMIYLKSPKVNKNENRLQQDRERPTDGRVGGIADIIGGQGPGASGKPPKYKYDDGGRGGDGWTTPGSVWG